MKILLLVPLLFILAGCECSSIGEILLGDDCIYQEPMPTEEERYQQCLINNKANTKLALKLCGTSWP